jgi:outer membrane lipoprotein-sorting protein
MATPSEQELAPLKKMIARGKEIRTLSAEIAETRHLKTLSRPVAGKGRIWFASPASFRWENGAAEQSILIGNDRGLFLIRKKEGNVTCRRLDDNASAPMTPFGIPGLFPGDYDALLRTFRVESIAVSGRNCHVEMTPQGGGTLRGIAALHLDFDTDNGRWTSLRIITRDGSSILQEFRNARINTPLTPELFDPERETNTSPR